MDVSGKHLGQLLQFLAVLNRDLDVAQARLPVLVRGGAHDKAVMVVVAAFEAQLADANVLTYAALVLGLVQDLSLAASALEGAV